MSANTYTYLDVEGPVRTWVRSLTALTDLFPTTPTNLQLQPTCFFGFPTDRALPVITMGQIGGPRLTGDHPQEDVDISFYIWGRTKAEASTIANALKSAIKSLVSYTTEGVKLQSGIPSQPIFQPDTSTDPDTPRYVMDSTFTCIAV